MMKSNYLLSMLALIVAGMLCLSSCGDDDEEGGENNPASGGNSSSEKVIAGALNGGLGVSDKPGYRIASAAGYQFGYDTNGNLTSIKFKGDDFPEGDELLQSMDPLTIVDYDYDVTNKVYFNNDGYVSKVIHAGNYDSGKLDGTFTFNYNSERQLKGFTVKLSGTDEDEPWTESSNVTFDYKSGNLTSATSKWSYTEVYEGESYSGSGMDRAILSYDNAVKNPYRQYIETIVTFFTYDCMILYLDPLFYLGLFGKSSAQLPSTINISWVDFDDEGETGSSIYTSSYTFNAEGALAEEDYMGVDIYNGQKEWTYNESNSYSYRWTNGTRASIDDGKIMPMQSTTRHHRFHHHRQHHRIVEPL